MAGKSANELFVRLWTAKEAMLKLSGEGLVGGLDRAISLSEQEGRLADQRIHLARLDWEGWLDAWPRSSLSQRWKSKCINVNAPRRLVLHLMTTFFGLDHEH